MAKFMHSAFEKLIDLFHSSAKKDAMLIGIPDHKKTNSYLDAVDTLSNAIKKEVQKQHQTDHSPTIRSQSLEIISRNESDNSDH